MADDLDESQKTEDPTPRRIEEAVKRGQVAYSREVGNFLFMLLFTFFLYWMLPGLMNKTALWLKHFIESPHDIDLSEGTARLFSYELVKHFLLIMILPLLFSMAIAFFASFLQNGFIVSGESIVPKLDKISPGKGLKRMFSTRSLAEFGKGLVKIIMVGFIAVVSIAPFMPEIENLPGYEIGAFLVLLWRIAFRIMIGVSIMMFIIAILDYLYQKFEYLKSLRMSKREIKEEMKQSEGDPIIKGRLKSIRMERARRRMMAAVPKADVIITNPTHFAVALKYEQAKMAAPVMVAKGADLIAFQIRKVAAEHNIPIVENPPLARALYSGVEIDEPIPTQHYQAVAEIIAYVFKLKNKKAA